MQAQQQQQPTFNMEAEQAKAEIDIAKKRAEIQAKLEADITLLTAKAGLESQGEEQPPQMQFPESTTPVEEDFFDPDDEQEQSNPFDPEVVKQEMMQQQSGMDAMPQGEQPPMGQDQLLPQQDIGNAEGLEGIL